MVFITKKQKPKFISMTFRSELSKVLCYKKTRATQPMLPVLCEYCTTV